MSKKEVLTFVLLVCLAVSCFVFAGTHTPWDGTKWDVASPDIDQPHGNQYKELYDLRKGVALRINKEHETLATSSAGGVHKQGSARAFFQDAAPTTQVDTSAFDAGDLGSLWFDSNASPDNQFLVLTATTPTWTPVSTEIIAVAVAAAHTWAASQTLGAGADLIGSSTSDITFNTDKFTVAGATGNTSVGGTFESVGVATLADASVTKSTAAPGADAQIANKKYVDDTVNTETDGDVPTTDDSGSDTMVNGHAYLAQTSGFVNAYGAIDGTKNVTCYVGTTTDPYGAGTLVASTVGVDAGDTDTIMVFVANGKYFEVRGTAVTQITWTPLVSGGAAPVDQD